MRLSRAEIEAAFARLETVYTVPKAARADRDAYVETWLAVLGWAQAHDLDDAVKAYLASSGEYWPKPGQLAAWINKHRPQPRTVGSALAERYRAWEANSWNPREVLGEWTWEACPVCGAGLELAPRIRVVHDVAAHRDAGVPAIGDTDETVAFYANLPRWEPRATPLDEAA